MRSLTEGWLARLNMLMKYKLLPCHDTGALFLTGLSLIVATKTHLHKSTSEFDLWHYYGFSSLTVSIRFYPKRNAEAERIMSWLDTAQNRDHEPLPDTRPFSWRANGIYGRGSRFLSYVCLPFLFLSSPSWSNSASIVDSLVAKHSIKPNSKTGTFEKIWPKREWDYTLRSMRKWKFDGKESDVYFNGSKASEQKVKKQMSRHYITVSSKSNRLTQLLFPVHRMQLPLQRPKLPLIVMLARPIHHNRGCQHP